MDGLENFGTPIIMVYLPLLLITFALSGNFNLFVLAAILAGLAFTILWIFLVSFAFTALSYGVGILLGGNVRIGRLYYMISLASAPTFIFTLVMNVASVVLKAILAMIWPPSDALNFLSLAGDLVAVAMTIYGMYLLTVSMDALYKSGKLKATAIWLVPLAILLGLAVTVFGTIIVAAAISSTLSPL